MYKVIIADDEAIMRKALLKLVDWESLNCKVIYAAEDGQAVIDYFETEKPDIIISDIRMPRIDGLRLAEYLSAHEPQIKLILLTAYADFSYAQQAIRYHVSEYVVKSGASDQVVAAIKRCTNQLCTADQTQSQQPDYREQFFKMAIEGNTYPRNSLAIDTIRSNIHDFPRYVLVQRLSFDGASSNAMHPELHRRTTSFLSDTLSAYVEAQFCIEGIYEYFVLRQLPLDLLETYCRKAQSSFQYVVGTPLHVGVSELCKTVDGLSTASRQAREALEYGFYDSRKTIHFYSRAHHFSSDSASFFSTQNARLATTLQLGAAAPSLDLLNETFEFQKRNNVHPSLVRKEGENLIALCKSSVAAAGKYWSDVLPDNIKKVPLSLQYCDQFDYYCKILTAIVDRTSNLIAKSLEQHNDIVLLAQSYIRANFQKDISLNDIASAVKVNPSYLSRTFKARTGTSIVDTITACRMEKAKILLAANHLRIQDIATEVGIENTTYFSQVFKKHVGMSPKDYQRFTERHTAEH